MAENAYFSMSILAYPIAAYMSQLEEWISYSWQHMKESCGASRNMLGIFIHGWRPSHYHIPSVIFKQFTRIS